MVWRFPESIDLALRAQLRTRHEVLALGAQHVGWKIAKSMPGVEVFLGQEGRVFGYLTSATLLGSGGSYQAGSAAMLRAETELALTVGRDLGPDGDVAACPDALTGVGVALEIVDVTQPDGGMREIIAANVFHRAVAFAPCQPVAALFDQAQAHLMVNGEVRESGPVGDDLIESMDAMARMLAAVGLGLRAGDRIITGSVTHVPVQAGDQVAAAIDGLGSTVVAITACRDGCGTGRQTPHEWSAGEAAVADDGAG